MRYLLGILMIYTLHASVGQGLTDEMKDQEEQFYASTKQVNQFFRRFNGEEDEKGERYTPSDKEYRSYSLRKKYLPALFDQESNQISESTASDFVKSIADKRSPAFLDFHSNDWLAEVQTVFSSGGREISGLLYMKLQKQGLGYEWVIDDVSFDSYKKFFDKDTSESKKFIHPMSHELDFMTFRKAFANDHKEQFTSRKFQLDQLSIFLYELNSNKLKFETVRDVKFHFFSIDGWYFSISNFNRPGYNSGWLIDNVVKIQDANHKRAMMNYVYDKN